MQLYQTSDFEFRRVAFSKEKRAIWLIFTAETEAPNVTLVKIVGVAFGWPPLIWIEAFIPDE